VNPSVANVFTVMGEPNTTTNPGNNVTGSSQVIATDFIYGGNPPGTLTLNGLTPGRNYLLTLYSVGWDPIGSRLILFSGNNGQQLLIDQDFFGYQNGILINYQYTASPTGSVTVTNAGTVSFAAFHLYGFANRELQPPTIQIVHAGSSVTPSWPGSVVGYTLQSSPVLGAGASWQPVSGVQLVGGLYQVTVPTTNGTQFFRLVK
jgi:hypothetical protein